MTLRHTSKGFSLVELVIVIGIIIIISGLMFPSLVATRVSALKSADKLKLRSMGLAVTLYAADCDDTLPSAYVASAQNRYERLTAIWVPTDWLIPIDDQDPVRGEYAWPNSGKGYWRNFDQLRNSISSDFHPRFLTPLKRPQFEQIPRIGYSFNGLLSQWSLSGISSTVDVPLFSQVFGDANLYGFALASPGLKCRLPGPCIYIGSHSGCSWSANGTTSSLVSDAHRPQTVYGRQQIFLNSDLSAKSLTVSNYNALGNPTNPAAEFYSRYEQVDNPFMEWKDRDGCHSLRFRPDFDVTDLSFALEVGSEGGFE